MPVLQVCRQVRLRGLEAQKENEGCALRKDRQARHRGDATDHGLDISVPFAGLAVLTGLHVTSVLSTALQLILSSLCTVCKSLKLPEQETRIHGLETMVVSLSMD